MWDKEIPVPVPVPSKTVPQNYPWLETKHFAPEAFDGTLLLCWDRPSGYVFRTGRWNTAKNCLVSSSGEEFRTQPNYFRSTEGLYP